MAEDKQKDTKTIEDFIKAYESLSVDIANVDALPYLDDLRKETWRDTVKRAKKLKDPAAMHESLAKFFGEEVRPAFMFYIGKAGLGPKDAEKSPLEEYTKVGADAFREWYSGRR